MNWKIYEWIGVQIFFVRYTNELEDIRMNCGSFFLEGKIYEWIGRYTTELGFRFFFGIIDVYFIFSIGGLGFWNPKIYEWIGRYTNELEDMRMNWKIYEWIMVQIFLEGKKKTNELEHIRMNWGSDFFWKIYEWIGRYTSELWFRFFFGIYTNELEDIRMNWGSDCFLSNKYLFYIYYWRIRVLKSEDIRMNWKIYEWIGVQFFFWNIYEWIGRYTNELWFRFFFEWKIYEWIGTYTNELGFRLFFRIIHIHFIFKIGGLLWCSKKLVTGWL